MERITQSRTDKGETVSGRMVETRSQKSKSNARGGGPPGPGHASESGNGWTGRERKQKASE